ncbi:MAG: hypothetical protein MUO21_00955, partial [Nitrososphaeraceae archaeon]|nr:hypothetical protein [Nitrososphaeraceae archaeon]
MWFQSDKKTRRIVLGTTLVIGSAIGLYKLTQPRWGESRRQQLGRLFRQIPYVENEYQKIIARETSSSIQSIKEKWAPFGDPILTIPDRGWSYDQLIGLIDHYNNVTTQN